MDTAYYAGHYLEVFQIAQLTGEIMLKNGAETYRVEDTITRILKTTGFSQIEAFTTLTGMVISMSDPTILPVTSVKRVQNRSNHLRKVEMANDVSRRLVGGKSERRRCLGGTEGDQHPSDELSEICGGSGLYPRLWVFLPDFWRQSP